MAAGMVGKGTAVVGGKDIVWVGGTGAAVVVGMDSVVVRRGGRQREGVDSVAAGKGMQTGSK